MTKADPKQTHVVKELVHDRPLTSCAFDPKGRYVFAGSEDYGVVRVKRDDGAKTRIDLGCWSRALGFSPDGETLYTGGYDGKLIWWPTAADAPQPVRSVQAYEGTAPWIRALDISPDGTMIAAGANDGIVKLWGASDGRMIAELKGHEANVYSVLFHPSGQFLLSGDLAGKLHQWSVADKNIVRTFDAQALHAYDGGQQVHYGGVRSISLSGDGKYLSASGLYKATNPLGAVNDPLVVLFEWESAKVLRQLTAGELKGIAWKAQFHPDGFLVCGSGGSGGGFILFWTPDQDREIFKLQMPDIVRDLDVHPDGLQIATAHYDGKLRLSSMTAAAKAG